MLIGIDDTDSLSGGCTTYIAALLAHKLNVLQLPKLVRLNPNIPYKTRGNAALAIEVGGDYEEVKREVIRVVKNNAFLSDPRTNPGIALVEKLSRKEYNLLFDFYRKALSQLVSISEARALAQRVGIELITFGNGRGSIGALAALGCRLKQKTFELIAYRTRENWKRKRKISVESVRAMDKATYPQTFDNIDEETGKVLITPHGYDPVYVGIRGVSEEAVLKAWNMLEVLEPVSMVQVFETNQATDVHYIPKKIADVRAYDCVVVEGEVLEIPKRMVGGHVFFLIGDDSGRIYCAAYEPTGNFRDKVEKLRVGDKLRVFGGVGKYTNTLNLEKFEVLEVAESYRFLPPICCGKTMTSAGRGKGWKCRKCGKRKGEKDLRKIKERRELEIGWYEVPPRARRHLVKPLILY